MSNKTAPFAYMLRLCQMVLCSDSLLLLHVFPAVVFCAYDSIICVTCTTCKVHMMLVCRRGNKGSSHLQQVDLWLSGEEASDYINFVVKDTSSGTWYDQGGSNYHIPLTGSVAMMSVDEHSIPDAELPDLPGELCGIWSYIKWEQAGCPNRSEEQSQAAYREAIEVSICSAAWHVQGADAHLNM